MGQHSLAPGRCRVKPHELAAYLRRYPSHYSADYWGIPMRLMLVAFFVSVAVLTTAFGDPTVIPEPTAAVVASTVPAFVGPVSAAMVEPPTLAPAPVARKHRRRS